MLFNILSVICHDAATFTLYLADNSGAALVDKQALHVTSEWTTKRRNINTVVDGSWAEPMIFSVNESKSSITVLCKQRTYRVLQSSHLKQLKKQKMSGRYSLKLL